MCDDDGVGFFCEDLPVMGWSNRTCSPDSLVSRLSLHIFLLEGVSRLLSGGEGADYLYRRQMDGCEGPLGSVGCSDMCGRKGGWRCCRLKSLSNFPAKSAASVMTHAAAAHCYAHQSSVASSITPII